MPLSHSFLFGLVYFVCASAVSLPTDFLNSRSDGDLDFWVDEADPSTDFTHDPMFTEDTQVFSSAVPIPSRISSDHREFLSLDSAQTLLQSLGNPYLADTNLDMDIVDFLDEEKDGQLQLPEYNLISLGNGDPRALSTQNSRFRTQKRALLKQISELLLLEEGAAEELVLSKSIESICLLKGQPLPDTRGRTSRPRRTREHKPSPYPLLRSILGLSPTLGRQNVLQAVISYLSLYKPDLEALHQQAEQAERLPNVGTGEQRQVSMLAVALKMHADSATVDVIREALRRLSAMSGESVRPFRARFDIPPDVRLESLSWEEVVALRQQGMKRLEQDMIETLKVQLHVPVSTSAEETFELAQQIFSDKTLSD